MSKRKFSTQRPRLQIADFEGIARPKDIDAEKYILGAMLADPRIVPTVRAKLSGEHFADLWHARVFDVLAGFEGIPTTRHVVEALKAARLVETVDDILRVDGFFHVFNIVCSVPYHVGAVLAAWQRAELLQAAQQIVTLALDRNCTPISAVISGRQSLEKITTPPNKVARGAPLPARKLSTRRAIA